MKALKIILILIGSITVIAVIGMLIFMNTASNETKEEVFKSKPTKETGIEKEIHIKCEINSFRRNIINTKWVIKGVVYGTSKKKNYTQQTVVFRFSDGKVYRIFNFHIDGSQSVKRPFEVRIDDHDDAEFLGAEVVEAK